MTRPGTVKWGGLLMSPCVVERSFARRVARSAALAGTCLAAFVSTGAAAQNEAEAQEQAAASPLEIVVTAERRATNLQDTPLSVLAITSEAIESKGIEDLQDLAEYSPNLTISPTRGSGNNAANFVIRGIGGGGGATGERGVGLYVDGVYMPRTTGAVLRVLDIDRVEVLRGPQGTLFGRNSTGGAVRIFSKAPTDNFEGYVRGTYGSMNRRDVSGMINVPLGENLAFRGQAAWLKQDGYVQNGTQDLGKEDELIARGRLRLDLGAFDATIGGLYSRSRTNASPLVFEEFDMRPGIEGFIQGNYADLLNDAFKAAGGAPLAAYNDPRIVRGDFTAPGLCFMDDFNPDYDPACNLFNNNTYWQGDLALNLDLGDNFSVHSITGISKLKHRGNVDFQVLGTEVRNDPLDSDVIYQELQFNASLFNGVLDLVAGGSYFHEKAINPRSGLVTRQHTSVYPANPGTPPNADRGLFLRAETYLEQVSDSYGLFLNGTLHVTDRLNLTGGLRKAWDKKDYLQTRYAATDFTPAPGTTSTTVEKSAEFDALDYRATIDYHLTPDVMAYATLSKAYKAGLFSYTIASWTAANNATGPNQSLGINPVPNEKVINREVGLRVTLFDRLRLNPTLFEMDYTDRQAAVQVTCNTGVLVGTLPGSAQCPVGFLILVTNQGDVKLRGVEVDGQILVTDNLSIDGSLGSTDPKLKDAPAGTVNLFPDVASPTWNLGATWNGNVGNTGELTASLSYAHIGEQETHPTRGTDSSYTLPSYGLLNGRVQFEFENLPLTVTLYGQNLLDKTYATYGQRFGGGFWDSGAGTGPAAPPRNALSVVRGRPREVGVTLQYNFGG
ncbi:TonB-dependent receptor [Tsuneonella sp. HG222]